MQHPIHADGDAAVLLQFGCGQFILHCEILKRSLILEGKMNEWKW